MKHQPDVSWAKTTCDPLCTSFSKTQHQWLQMTSLSVLTLGYWESFPYSTLQLKCIHCTQRLHGNNGFECLEHTVEEWFLFILLQHHSLWKQGVGNKSLKKKKNTPLLFVKKMPKYVSVRATKFRTEFLYENRSKAYYVLCKLWYCTLEQKPVCWLKLQHFSSSVWLLGKLH